MVNVVVSPSILSANPLNLLEDITKIEKAGADWHHIDVMDGHFVPNLTFGLPLIKALKKQTSLPLDVHIMVANPDEVALQYVEAGADFLTFHLEAATDPLSIVQSLRSLEVKVGIAINPETNIAEVYPYIDKIDLILLMSVNPGKGGQTFIESTYSKIDQLQQTIAGKSMKQKPIISVDGGVNSKNAKTLIAKGVNALVAGSFVYGASSPQEAVSLLKQQHR